MEKAFYLGPNVRFEVWSKCVIPNKVNRRYLVFTYAQWNLHKAYWFFISDILSKTQKLNPVAPAWTTQIGEFDARGRLSQG